MTLGQIFKPETIILNLESAEKDELFEEMVVFLKKMHPNLDCDEALCALNEREQKMTTGILPKIAIPHAICRSVQGIYGAIGISANGIDYDATDSKPVHFIFMILASPLEIERNVQILKRLETILTNKKFVQKIEQCKNISEINELIEKFDSELN